MVILQLYQFSNISFKLWNLWNHFDDVTNYTKNIIDAWYFFLTYFLIGCIDCHDMSTHKHKSLKLWNMTSFWWCYKSWQRHFFMLYIFFRITFFIGCNVLIIICPSTRKLHTCIKKIVKKLWKKGDNPKWEWVFFCISVIPSWNKVNEPRIQGSRSSEE